MPAAVGAERGRRPDWLGAALCAQGLLASVHVDRVLGREDTRAQALDWLTANVPPGGKVVVEPFSEERYGVGYSLDHPEMCQWIVDTIGEAQEDGSYDDAFQATLGESGVDTPEAPEMDACPAA